VYVDPNRNLGAMRLCGRGTGGGGAIEVWLFHLVVVVCIYFEVCWVGSSAFGLD
jgi:hypothetical protein